MKFYHAENSNRIIQGKSGRPFTFEPYNFLGGSWFGIYRTDKAPEISALDELVKDEKSAVTEISQEEYAKCAGKKHLLPESFRSSNNVSVTTDQSAAALVVGAPVSSVLSPPPSASVESVEDVLKVEAVASTGNTPVIEATPQVQPVELAKPEAKPKAAKKKAASTPTAEKTTPVIEATPQA